MIHNRSKWSDQRPSMVSRPRLVVVHGFLISLLLIANPVYAQVTTSITPTPGAGNLGTSVTQAGNVYNITGGTRPENGTNLFHSFGNFSVGTGDIGNFLNTPVNGVLPPTSNILGRVTNGNISNIFGTIQTTNFGNANLFLMNPAGFLFGPNATVNVGGMVAFTSADYLKLTDNARFNAIPNAAVDALLSASPVAAFGFLGLNPGAITVHGSQFTVTEGTGISLVGDNIAIEAGTLDDGTVQSARLSAPGGQINLASVVSSGEVLTTNYDSSANITLGSISLSEGTVLDVSADTAGTIKIRGGQFVMADATLSANTVNSNGALTAIDINLTGDLSISDTRAVPTITARTTGAGNAGEVQIVSANLQATSTDPGFAPFALLDTHSSGSGSAGSVTISTDNLTVSGPAGTWHFIDSGPQAAGPGGNILIEAQHNIELTGTTISTGTQLAERLGVEASGPAGNLTLIADRLLTDRVLLLTTAAFEPETQQAGNVTMNVRDISMANSTVSAAGFFGGGAITVNSDSLITEATQFDTFTALGQAEGITFNGRILELRSGSTWSTSTFGDSNAGDIRVVASDHVTLLGGGGDPSGLFSNSFGELGVIGGSGSITVTTPKLIMNGGRINSSTATSGRGGDVTINAGTVEMSGEFPFPDVGSGWFGITDIHPSGIFTQTVGSEFCAGPCGDAGNIVANIGTLIMGPGAQLNSGTTNTGQGGTITINATNTISMSGTLSNGDPVGIFSRTIGSEPDAGPGGNISLTAGQSVTISDGASVSASSTGSGNAGNITIQGLASPAESVLIDGPSSGVFTDTQGTGTGGNIFVNANTVTLQNGSTLSAMTSGTEATATGGTITVHASQVLLNNQANITATSTRQPNKPNSGAGNAGTITMTAEENIVLLGNSSIASAAEGEGNGGLVSLTAPSIEMHGNSNIVTATAGLGNAGDIELQGNQVNLTESFVTARTQAEGSGGNVTIRGLSGEGSHATDVRLSDNSQLVSETIGDGENIQGAAGNILVETARLNLSGGSLFNTTSRGSTGAAGNITVNATDLLTISGFGSQLTSQSVESSFGDAGDISISAPSVVIENNGHITTSTGLVGNAGTITVNANNLQLLSGGHITSSNLAEVPELSSGVAGTVNIQGLGTLAQSVFINGPGSGIFTDTQGTGAGGNIFVKANSIMLQNGGILSAKTSGTESTATGGTITVDATNTVTMNSALITAESAGVADAGSINITSPNGFTMQSSTITTQAGQGAGGGNIKVTTSPSATVLLQDSLISASVADGHGGGGNISIDPQFVILQNSQILAQAAQGQGGAITITAGLFLQDANSKVNADSGSGVNGTVTIQSPNAPASGKIQPLGKTPLQATSLLNQHCAALAGGEFSSFTVAGRDSLPTEPGSWLASPLATLNDGMGLGVKTEGVKVEGEKPVVRGEGLEGETAWLSLRQIAPPGFLTQAFAVDWSVGCKS